VRNMGLPGLTSLSCSLRADLGYNDRNRGRINVRKRHSWTEELKEHKLYEEERSISLENYLFAIW
jgi:hypothetical protein